jgi:hypothetical protein
LPLLATAAAAKEPPSVVALERALDCRHVFHPQGVLGALRRDGIIARKPISQVDGIPVFPVRKPFRIHGLAVKFVEGWDYEGSLFFFAAGTAPGTRIGIVVAGDKATAAAAFPQVERSGAGHSWFRYAAGTEVTCTQT